AMQYALGSQEAVARSAAVRRFMPSYADFFLVALLVWLFTQSPGWSRLLHDGDTGWHIRTGDHILAARSVPHHDLFSYSHPGASWFAWEWLTDVLFSLVHTGFGLAGVAVVCGLTIVLSSTLVLRQMAARGANTYIA